MQMGGKYLMKKKCEELHDELASSLWKSEKTRSMMNFIVCFHSRLSWRRRRLSTTIQQLNTRLPSLTAPRFDVMKWHYFHIASRARGAELCVRWSEGFSVWFPLRRLLQLVSKPLIVGGWSWVSSSSRRHVLKFVIDIFDGTTDGASQAKRESFSLYRSSYSHDMSTGFPCVCERWMMSESLTTSPACTHEWWICQEVWVERKVSIVCQQLPTGEM